jgi:hypothetical protein
VVNSGKANNTDQSFFNFFVIELFLIDNSHGISGFIVSFAHHVKFTIAVFAENLNIFRKGKIGGNTFKIAKLFSLIDSSSVVLASVFRESLLAFGESGCTSLRELLSRLRTRVSEISFLDLSGDLADSFRICNEVFRNSLLARKKPRSHKELTHSDVPLPIQDRVRLMLKFILFVLYSKQQNDLKLSDHIILTKILLTLLPVKLLDIESLID